MQKIITAAGPVIIKDNKILLDIQGDDSFWKFCGGKVKENETLQQAATRRAKEELGINIKIINTEPYLFYTTKEKEGGFSDIIVAHFLSTFSGDITPGEDVARWKWIDINNLPNNLAPSILPALKHFEII